MDYTITKNCKECGDKFTISAGERKWLQKKGLKEFSRCKSCRAKGKGDREVEQLQQLKIRQELSRLLAWTIDQIQLVTNARIETFAITNMCSFGDAAIKLGGDFKNIRDKNLIALQYISRADLIVEQLTMLFHIRDVLSNIVYPTDLKKDYYSVKGGPR